MTDQFSENQWHEMALQLSRPNGEAGISIANQMYSNNIGMIKNTVKCLSFAHADKVLEIGHGNGRHIQEIIGDDHTTSYTGLEISELMHEEAKQSAVNAQASFYLYDGIDIPFSPSSFDKIMTVNTLYFWKSPKKMLTEIYRVLKPSGKFDCAFAERDFMEKLPFTKHVFQLYTAQEFEELVAKTGFRSPIFEKHTEQVSTKNGELVERPYTIAILEK